ERRAEFPPGVGAKEAVIAKMIVGIVDRRRQGDPPKELSAVATPLTACILDRLDDIDVVSRLAVVAVCRGHRADVSVSLVSVAVAPVERQHWSILDSQQPRVRDGDACSSGQFQGDTFPQDDVPLIAGSGELRYEQPAVIAGHRCFGPSTAERSGSCLEQTFDGGP